MSVKKNPPPRTKSKCRSGRKKGQTHTDINWDVRLDDIQGVCHIRDGSAGIISQRVEEAERGSCYPGLNSNQQSKRGW